MTRVAGVFDNFYGLPLTPPALEVLDGRKLGPSDVLGNTHSVAVAIPGSDALDGAAVQLFEDLRTHANSFQSPEGE